MRIFVITLASVPVLVLGRPAFGVPTTLVKVPSPPATITNIPNISPSDIARRDEATQAATTTAAGILGILRRDDEEDDLDTDAFATPDRESLESEVVEEMSLAKPMPGYMMLKKKARSPVVEDRDLGLPSLPGVLAGSSSLHQAASTQALSTSRADDSEATSTPNVTVVHEAQNGTIPANGTGTFTSYPSPKVTKTEFRFDSAAVNGVPSTSSPALPSQTVVARQANDTSSTNSTSGLDLNSKYVCSADVVVQNGTSAANSTTSGVAAMGTGTPANSTSTVYTAYHCYERHPNATASATGTTLMTVTTKAANATLTDAEVTRSITDTFSVTSMATPPPSTTAQTAAATAAAATTSSGGLLSGLTGGL